MQNNPTPNAPRMMLKDMIRHALSSITLYGAEGEGQEPGQTPVPTGGDGGTGTTEAGGAGAGTPPTPATSSASTDTFDRAYVEELRTEAAKWRVQARELETKVKEFESANLSATEKQAKELEALRAENQTLKAESATRRRNDRVLEVARELKFNDPADAIGFIPSDVSLDEEGLPTSKAIRGALERVAKDKPYLVTPPAPPPPGSGDGGAAGTPVTPGREEREDRYRDQYASKGAVEMIGL